MCDHRTAGPHSKPVTFPFSIAFSLVFFPDGVGDDAVYVLAVDSVPSLSSVVKRAQLWHWLYAKVRTYEQ